MIPLKRPVVQIEASLIDEMIANVETISEECCGFLFGHEKRDRTITKIIPATNVAPLNKRVRFEVDPLEYLAAERYASDNNLELLGIYHSHPEHPAVPSQTDLNAAQPYFSYVILSVIGNQFAAIRSWRLNHHRQFEEESITQ